MGYWLDQIRDQERKTEINNATTYKKALLQFLLQEKECG